MDASRIRLLLAQLGASIGQPLSFAATTTSTNDDAKLAAGRGAPHGAVFLAEAQTAGRGRGDHQWHSPTAENVYLSVVLRPDVAAAELAPLSLVVGVATARVIDAALRGRRAMLKWPNDVYVDAHKIAGVLIEAITRPSGQSLLVVGVGVNVLTRQFPDHFATPPTSLALQHGEVDRERLAAELIDHIGQLVGAFEREGMAAVADELESRDFLRGRSVTANGVRGVAAGIDDRGRLLVRDGSGALQPIISGEVTWR